MQNLQQCTITQKDTGVFLANEQKIKWVTLITFVTMIVEIVVGYWSESMALLADGWHMASHTLALFLSVLVYYLYRQPKFQVKFTFGGGKILSLGGYTSALFLFLIAGSMIYESVLHFYTEKDIQYDEALLVAVIGLVVNLICAYILHDGGDAHHHHHQHGESCSHSRPKKSHSHDHTHESTYVHILTDALTSVLAIFALLMGKWQGWSWLDPAVGLLGGLVVLKWSIGIIHQSGLDLLDAHDVSIDRDILVNELEVDGSKVIDIHLWKLAPGQVGGEIIIQRNREQTSSYYRDMIQNKFDIQHLIIEVV